MAKSSNKKSSGPSPGSSRGSQRLSEKEVVVENKFEKNNNKKGNKIFKRKSKVIGQNDILWDPNTKKIKLSPEVLEEMGLPLVQNVKKEEGESTSDSEEGMEGSEEGADGVTNAVTVRVVKDELDIPAEDSGVNQQVPAPDDIGFTAGNVGNEVGENNEEGIAGADGGGGGEGTGSGNIFVFPEPQVDDLSLWRGPSMSIPLQGMKPEDVLQGLKELLMQKDNQIRMLEERLKMQSASVNDNGAAETSTSTQTNVKTETAVVPGDQTMIGMPLTMVATTSISAGVGVENEPHQYLEEEAGARPEVGEPPEKGKSSISELCERICQKIPKGIENKEDLQKCCNSLAEMNTALEAVKVKYLFEDVINIIIKQGNEKGQIKWSEKTPILKKCRLVCKSWKKTVDLLLEHHESHLDLIPQNYSLGPQKEHFTPCPFKIRSNKPADTQKLQNFLHGTFPSFINPLPTRHLMIEITHSLKNYIETWNKYSYWTSEYLNLFGTHIWSLTLIIDGRYFVPEAKIATYTAISQWLHSVPNLKSLVIDVVVLGGVGEKEESVRKEIGQLTFPYLENLTTVQSDRGSDLFVYCLLKKNPHVQMIRLKNSEDILRTMKLELSNLSEVSFKIRKESNFLNLATVPWKLEKLYLSLPINTESLMKSVITVVGKFKDTLKFLRIELTGLELFPQDEKLDLPNLKHLQFRFSAENLSRMDSYLGEMRELETMTIEMMDLIHFDQEMTCSNLNNALKASCWFKLPKLETVNFCSIYSKNQLTDLDVRRLRLRRRSLEPVRFNIVKINGEAAVN